jgi:hypothetical protein
MDTDETTNDLVRKFKCPNLTTSNYMMFVVSFRNNVGSYGDAGLEIIKETYMDFSQTYPFKTKTVLDYVRTSDGLGH